MMTVTELWLTEMKITGCYCIAIFLGSQQALHLLQLTELLLAYQASLSPNNDTSRYDRSSLSQIIAQVRIYAVKPKHKNQISESFDALS